MSPDDGVTPACANCDAALGGAYCSACGQRRARRLGFGRVVAEALRHLAQLDSSLVRTIVGLTRDPGGVARAYIAGRRTAYLNPIKYVFLTATLYAVLAHLLDFHFGPQGRAAPGGSVSAGTGVTARLMGLIGYMVFLIQLPVAGLQRLLFRRGGVNMAEAYAALLFWNGHLLLLGVVAHLVGLYATTWGFAVLMGISWLYFVWAITGLYRHRHVVTGAKATLLFVVYTILRFAVGALFTMAFVRWGR